MNTAETEFDLGNKCVIQRNFKEAIVHYKQSAQNGYADAQYNLGFCYSHGIGVEQNYLEAITWYNKAIAKGLSQAEDLLNELKTHGDADAQYFLGGCYAKGHKVTKDYKQAVCWFTLAAKQGHVNAQWTLGEAYYSGYGVTRDYRQALYWYTRAAEQGHIDAQYYLGVGYEIINQDYNQALYWYTRAAEQGHAYALHYLNLYYSGQNNNIPLKEDSDSISTYLRDNNISCFYHFTALENIESIRQHGGLYSWHYCENNGIQIPIAGGDAQSRRLDGSYGLQDYVRLSFCDDHPMSYRLIRNNIQVVLLKISTDVALWRSTKFSDINAADRNHRIGSDCNFLRQNINIPVTQRHYVRNDDPDFKPHQAEILVERFIPVQYILNIDEPLNMNKL